MAITSKDFQTIVRDTVTAIQAGSSRLVDLTVGSVLRALVEAYASVALWLQGLIIQLLATTRASTSRGADLDTWMADFGLQRLPATFATGLVTFSRFTTSSQAVVPIGAAVQTADGAAKFFVTLNDAHASYSEALGGYVLPVSTASVSVPVQALEAGTAGNAVAGAINTLAAGVPGVDTVSNAADFDNGSDAEFDAALRTRFVAFIASLSKATKAAVQYAVNSLQSGVTSNIVENEEPDGDPRPGFFFVVVDDGSGAPSSPFLATAASAVDATRPLCSTFAVLPPTVITAAVAMTITTAVGANHGAVAATVAAAITAYINSLPLGQGLTYTRLIQVAYDASPSVTNVSGLTVNGGTADIAGNSQNAIKAGTVVVS